MSVYNDFLIDAINQYLRKRVYENILNKKFEYRIVNFKFKDSDIIDYFMNEFESYDIYFLQVDYLKASEESYNTNDYIPDDVKDSFEKVIIDKIKADLDIDLYNERYRLVYKIISHKLYTSELLTFKEFEEKYKISPYYITPENISLLERGEYHKTREGRPDFNANYAGTKWILEDSKVKVIITNMRNIEMINYHFDWLEANKFVIKLDGNNFYVTDKFIDIENVEKYYKTDQLQEELIKAVNAIDLRCNN